MCMEPHVGWRSVLFCGQRGSNALSNLSRPRSMATAALLADIRQHLTSNPAQCRRFCQNEFLRKDLKQIATIVCEVPIPRNRLAHVPEKVPLDQVAPRLAALTGHPFEESHIVQLWESLQELDLYCARAK